MSIARVCVLALLVLLALFAPSTARADNVDQLISELSDGSERVRLSAVLNLTKQGDPRGIEPLIRVLGNDSDKKVRSAAAVGLGIIVTPKTKKDLRAKAIAALQKAASSDSAALVQAQAEKSAKTLGEQAGSSGPSTGPAKGIYVNVGPMSSKTGDTKKDPKLKALMNKTAGQTLGRVASSMQTTWPGGNNPTEAQLRAKGFSGFYVDGTLNELKTTTSGNTATVSCKVSMLLASFPSKDMFGFLNGGAKVQGSASPRDVEMAGEDCVMAVMEDLIAKKIVPTIKSKAGSP